MLTLHRFSRDGHINLLVAIVTSFTVLDVGLTFENSFSLNGLFLRGIIYN